MPHAYHQELIDRLRVAFAPFAPVTDSTTPKLYIAAGEPIFSSHEQTEQSYLVTSGEVLIFRNGQPVDLLEKDDLLDLHLWPGATAMALSSCTLVALSSTLEPQ